MWTVVVIVAVIAVLDAVLIAQIYRSRVRLFRRLDVIEAQLELPQLQADSDQRCRQADKTIADAPRRDGSNRPSRIEAPTILSFGPLDVGNDGRP